PFQRTERCRIRTFTKSLAMSGNGRALPTRRIQVIAWRRGRSASTTASSCAISTSCAEVPVLQHVATFGAPIAIFSNPKIAGSLQASDSHAIHNDLVGATAGRAAFNAKMTGDSLAAP